MRMKKKSKSLKFYCSGCAKDYAFRKFYSHKCKKTFNERMSNIPSVFRCNNCHSAFAIPEQCEEHESWCEL